MQQSLSHPHRMLCEEVIEDIRRRGEIVADHFPVNAIELEREYALAQAIDLEHIACDDIDIVVVLSGRSGFSGTYVEKRDKISLCPDQFDPTDTSRRVAYGIEIAKKCTQANQIKGIDKPVYIYFNGLPE